ncbi:hypothetical protein KW783_00465 [Candidatus Parcubacteria bacterium]|nr:hypothetical protein [Candidatus Parcubacteria bacterium]
MHEEIQKEIDDLNSRISELKQHASSLGGREREECYRVINKTEDKKNKLSAAFDQFKDMGSETRENVKQSIEKGVSEVKDDFKSIYSRFKM